MPPLGQLRPWGVWPVAEEARLLAHHGGRGRAGLQGGAHGKEPLGGQKGAGQGGGTHGCDGSGPTEAVLEAGVPSCFIGGEGDPAPPSPHPMRGGPHIQERRWLHAPGVSTCLSQEERDSSSSAPGPARPTEGADAHSLTPWSRTGTGTLQPKSEGLGVKRRRPSAGHPQATETGGGSIQGTRAEPLSRLGPRVPPAPPSPSFLPRRFLSLLSCRGVTDALARKWGNRKKRAPPSPPRPADLGLPEGRAALGAAFAASPSAVLGWLRRGPMEAVPPPPPPRESQQVAPPLCPQAPEAPSQQVFLRRRPVRGGASGGSRVPQPCACRTLLRASPLFGHSASLGPGMVAEWRDLPRTVHALTLGPTRPQPHRAL